MRLDTYGFADDELTGAIDRLLADRALEARAAGVAKRLQAAAGTGVAASLIERVAVSGAPVARAV